jgi:hypothetical protein
MCDSDQSVCGNENFCYLTDPLTTTFNTIDRMKLHVAGDSNFNSVDSSQLQKGCLPKDKKELFKPLRVKSSDCSVCNEYLVGCNKDTCPASGCIFTPGILSFLNSQGECKSCSEANIGKCEDYGEDDCQVDPCKIRNCFWKEGSCKRIVKPYKILVVPLTRNDRILVRSDCIGENDMFTMQFDKSIDDSKIDKLLSEDHLKELFDNKMPCKLDMEVTRLPAFDISDVKSYPEIFSPIKTYVANKGIKSYNIVVTTFKSAGSSNGFHAEGISHFDGRIIMLATEPRYLTTDKSILHETGHITFGLCDEGYDVMKVPESVCSSTIGECVINDEECSSALTNCPTCDKVTCCPNTPDRASIMCSDDQCDTECQDSDSYSDSSQTQIKKVLEENGYC